MCLIDDVRETDMNVPSAPISHPEKDAVLDKLVLWEQRYEEWVKFFMTMGKFLETALDIFSLICL
jgi:hypothetical protein